MAEPALEAARASGLVTEGAPLLVMLSGGADSVCLLDVALRLGADVSALHVNYGLRAESGQDEEHCRSLCERLGVELTVVQARLAAEGNVQAQARDARYAAAEQAACADYAAAHTASDQAETVLYRLAVSPGRRALTGMEPRRGRLVRPLLDATRADTRDYCRERGLPWREDLSNDDPRFARARVRNSLLAALLEVAPAAEGAVAETARQLREEGEVLDAVAAEALAGLGGGPVVELAALRQLPAATARLVLRALAGMPLDTTRVGEIMTLGEEGGTRSLDLGEGLRVVVEYGMLRFDRAGPPPEPVPASLPVPGTTRFGDWEVRAGPAGEVTVAVDGPLVVRAWRDGDRIHPVGLGGSKTLGDLFTDRKVPRELRRTLPVVVSGDDVVWVAGVAVDERFAAPDGAGGAVGLSASLSRP
ncbi:MAG TPA: tRNA lysidine(34) synthetase TilS [Thermoleophilaceae bacterium]|nr:tRNA lysidine(34) synthetase TilS [Thermoleophilaceae bacterium]